MTRDELLAYKQRWQLVQAREVEERRAAIGSPPCPVWLPLA